MTCAAPAHGYATWPEASFEQIQFLLGHASVETTERYLGCKQITQPRGERQPRTGRHLMGYVHSPQADLWGTHLPPLPSLIPNILLSYIQFETPIAGRLSRVRNCLSMRVLSSSANSFQFPAKTPIQTGRCGLPSSNITQTRLWSGVVAVEPTGTQGEAHSQLMFSAGISTCPRM